MTLDSKIEGENKYLIKPWYFGPRNSLGDRIAFAEFASNITFLPILTTVAYFGSGRNTDAAFIFAGLMAIPTLAAYATDRIQTTGLTWR